MRVDTRLAAQGPAAASAGRRTEGGRAFSLDASEAGGSAHAPAATTTLAGLDAVLMLQNGEESPGDRRRRFARRGHDLLDGLDRLKAAILMGRVPAHELQVVARRLSERASLSGDPRLDTLMAEIELRAAVELAKLGRSRAG
ncbi:flagellar assembly protein FliX [Methylobacterium durans]|uniref:Flagellar assembly protein fliX n=1 Tax=Methylobacterium durans TaxID=2202825 RepID=A0A2U8W707_9HYPH|nr:flagellar assembly protein FliX [Methylobacterium durans]AWN41874.1 flagellar assembly protein fliX [Methylobacterium durans]